MTTLIPVLLYLLLSLVLTRFIAARQDKASLYQDKAARFFLSVAVFSMAPCWP